MKKYGIIGLISALVLLITVGIIFGITAYTEQQKAVDIIGGADGPTAVFVTGELTKILLPVCLIGVAMVIGLVVMIGKRKRS